MHQTMSAEEDEDTIDAAEEERGNPKFICGVCEGFYGKPWTTDQRIELFSRMQRFQLNCYLYAPKDDCKHRLYWRDKYTAEEETDLKKLIDEATGKQVTFVYAISPGLDITYSSSKDVKALEDKLDQVHKLGCTNFALLFDDIEPDMCGEDKAKFDSVAHAQCTVTNAIYERLKPEVFLFCPTEYCESRTVPSLKNSSYLKTIGCELNSKIIITWTGNHVVPRLIEDKDIAKLSEIIKRKPLIWENLFANDYDQTRLYLGPYDGRNVQLKGKLAGVLLNPNCEFEMNFVAMHTTAQWMLDCVQTFPLLECSGQDVEMEDQTEPSDSAEQVPYTPRKALEKALTDWRDEFYKRPEYSQHQAHLTKKSEPEDGDDMETEDKHKRTIAELDQLELDDLFILSDLFCLPFDYGPRAVHFLKKAYWLISNVKRGKGESNQSPDWYDNALHFNDCYRNLAILADKVINIPNRDILYDLYFYLSDMRSTLCLINSYIKWHGMGKPNKAPFRAGEQEPWLFRGGLHGEFRRLLPTEGRSDMFTRKEIRRATSRFFTVRPYFSADKDALYNVCRLTWDDGFDCLDIQAESYPDLFADELVGGFLLKSSDLCYVLEDELSMCGFVVAAANGVEFQEKLKEKWIQSIKEKYPEDSFAEEKAGKEKEVQKVLQEVLKSVREGHPVLPFPNAADYPSVVHLRVQYNRLEALSPADRLLTCITKALKDKGSKGMHTKIHKSHQFLKELFERLDFHTEDCEMGNYIILAKKFNV